MPTLWIWQRMGLHLAVCFALKLFAGSIKNFRHAVGIIGVLNAQRAPDPEKTTKPTYGHF